MQHKERKTKDQKVKNSYTNLKHIYISENVIIVDVEDHLPRTNMLKCDRVSEWYLYLFDQQKCIYFLNENLFDNSIISPS